MTGAGAGVVVGESGTQGRCRVEVECRVAGAGGSVWEARRRFDRDAPVRSHTCVTDDETALRGRVKQQYTSV